MSELEEAIKIGNEMKRLRDKGFTKYGCTNLKMVKQIEILEKRLDSLERSHNTIIEYLFKGGNFDD